MRHKSQYLIYIVIFITTIILRLLLISPKDVRKSQVSIDIFIKEIPKHCIFNTLNYQTYIEGCERLEAPQRVIVTGSTHPLTSKKKEQLSPNLSTLSVVTDTFLFEQKRLTVSSIAEYAYNPVSFSDWWRFLSDQTQKFVILLKGVIQQKTSYSVSWLLNNSVFGYVSLIPNRYQDSLEVLGLQHIIAVSGFHVSFIILLLQAAMPYSLAKGTQATIICLVMTLYWLLVGSQPSVNRAMFMGMGGYLLQSVGLIQVKPLHLLWLSAVFWLIVEPKVITSVSFQLSYLATFGIVRWYSRSPTKENVFLNLEVGQRIQQRIPLFYLVKEAFQASFIAQLYTLPVLWYHFKMYPTLSLLANASFFWLPSVLILAGLVALLLALGSLVPLLAINLLSSTLLNVLAFGTKVLSELLGLGVHASKTLVTMPELSVSQALCIFALIMVITESYYSKKHGKKVVSEEISCVI